MKSNSTDGNEGRSTGRLDSTASAEHVTDLSTEEDGLNMDEYCSVLDDFGCVAYEEDSGPTDGEDDEKTRLIRVQAAADDCLDGITSRDDVWRKIHEVQQTQSEYGRAELYQRQWQSETDQGSDTNNMKINGDTKHSFTVMQFNTLAEGLSSGPCVKTPFPCDPGTDKDSEKNCFGGFTEIEEPEIALDFNLRRWRLLEVMLGSQSEQNDPPYDIFAMEEVDRYRGFFAPVLKQFGYRGIFVPKFRAPGVQLGFYSDGCAMFWKTSTFELVSERRLSYRIGNQAFIIATLRHKQSDRHVVVGVTHLKARNSVNNEKVRMRQVCELLEKLEEERQAVQDEKDVPTLILGDFNADYPSARRDESCVAKVLDHHKEKGSSGPRYYSAYPVDPPPAGFFTTWKTRGTETVKRVIDYIFHSNVSCTDILCIPDEKEIEVDQLPGLRYPSDHLMIAAKFDL